MQPGSNETGGLDSFGPHRERAIPVAAEERRRVTMELHRKTLSNSRRGQQKLADFFPANGACVCFHVWFIYDWVSEDSGARGTIHGQLAHFVRTSASDI